MNKLVIFLEFKDYSKDARTISYIDGEIYSGILDNKGYVVNANIGDVDKCLGEFFYLFVNKEKKLEIKTDFCGLYSLFYKKYQYHGKKGVLISNCFHSISQYSELDPEISLVIPNIFSKDQIFAQGYTNQTVLKDINRLAWNERLIITSAGLEVVTNTNVIEGSYSFLLKKGIEKSQSIMKNLDLKQTLNLSLSGGKDSRAILSMLLNMGIMPKCTTVSPHEYQGDEKEIINKDFIIANKLMNHFNLQWFSMSQRFARKIDFFESLDRHTFFRSGYYLYKPIQYWVYSGDWGDDVQLRGGGGGLYKSTWGTYIKNGYFNDEIKNTYNSFQNDSDIIFEKLVPNKGLYQSLYNSAKHFFYDSLVSSRKDEDGIYKALDQHYISHRNHYHFGHLRDTASEGNKVFYPLINEFFYAANEMLSDREKDNGKIIFDIIENCYPELNNYAYDDGYHVLLPQGRRKVLYSSGIMEKSFLKMKEIEANMLKGIFVGKNYNTIAESSNYIKQAISEINDRRLLMIEKQSALGKHFTEMESNNRQRGKLLAILGGLPLDSNSSFSHSHKFMIFR